MALAGMAAAQARAGLSVTIVATFISEAPDDVASRNAAIKRLESSGVTVRLIGPAKDPMSRHPQLRSIMTEMARQADVVHVHAMWEQMQYEAARAAREAGVPYVFTPHGMLDPWNMSKGNLKKRLYLALRMRKVLQGAALLHFTTETERRVVQRLQLTAPMRVEPLGIDRREFADLPDGGVFRMHYPQLAGKKIVLFLGRLDRGKGMELLIPAMARLNIPNVVLVAVGPDSLTGYRATVESMIREHRVGDRVVLTGMLQGRDKLAALVDADLLALPSFHENFGVVVVEALACNCPVLVSNQVYLQREIEGAGVGGVCGLTVESVALELRRWLTEDSLRAAASAKARQFALTNFDWQVIAQHWKDHYARLARAR